jgi:hypothetical protein
MLTKDKPKNAVGQETVTVKISFAGSNDPAAQHSIFPVRETLAVHLLAAFGLSIRDHGEASSYDVTRDRRDYREGVETGLLPYMVNTLSIAYHLVSPQQERLDLIGSTVERTDSSSEIRITQISQNSPFKVEIETMLQVLPYLIGGIILCTPSAVFKIVKGGLETVKTLQDIGLNAQSRKKNKLEIEKLKKDIASTQPNADSISNSTSNVLEINNDLAAGDPKKADYDKYVGDSINIVTGDITVVNVYLGDGPSHGQDSEAIRRRLRFLVTGLSPQQIKELGTPEPPDISPASEKLQKTIDEFQRILDEMKEV